ncbi:MAG: helix-turn-helix domain-containing protein [Prevotellaceae bacterium]|nr:helix-turn-helix domain-containing protein [Prevotellaceae bacterium]
MDKEKTNKNKKVSSIAKTKKGIRNLNLKNAIIRISKTSLNFMGNDLMMFSDFSEVPIPKRAFKMDCTFVVICKSGSAKFALNTIEREIKQNDIILVNTNETVESVKITDDFNAMTIFISHSLMEDIIMNYEDISSLLLFSREHPIIHLADEDAIAFQEYFQMLQSRIDNSDNHFRKEIVRSLMLSWIYYLSNIIYNLKQTIIDNNKRRADIIFANFLKLVEENFRTERRVTWYSDKLCISPKYLSTVIKDASHRTPNDWIDYYVILEARVMLKNTNKSIKEVADYLNFPNQSFFGKFFKERVGCSPLAFRRNQI